MQIGTGIMINVEFNNPALPKLIDYNEVIAENAACVGAWRFDRDDLIVEDENGISEILCWKENGPKLTFIAGAKAARVQDAALGHRVARFSSAGKYLMSGADFDPRNAYTIVAIFKADSYSTIQNIAGSHSSVTAERANMYITKSLQDVPIVRSHRGSRNIGASVDDQTKYVAAYASFAAGGDYLPSVQLLGQSASKATGENTESIVGTLPFEIGDDVQGLVGDLDFVALFTADLIYQQADLKGHVDDYLDLRLGN